MQASEMGADDHEADGHGADLRLAAACARGDPAALRELERRFLGEVPAYVARLDSTPAFAAEVQQRLRVKLLVSEGGAPPRIASYTGRGPLGAWLRVAAIRTARDLLRGRRDRPLDDDGAIPLGSVRRDPELEYMKKHYREDLAEAFAKTLAARSDKERNVLCLYYVEGMSSAAIGKLYGVEGATVRLWIKQYRGALLDEMRRAVGERLRLDASELESVVRLVQSQLDVSISGLLRVR